MTVSVPIRLDIFILARSRHDMHLEQSADGPKRSSPQATEVFPVQSFRRIITGPSEYLGFLLLERAWTQYDTTLCIARLSLCCDAKSDMRCTQLGSNKRRADV